MPNLYLRPLGFLYGSRAVTAIADGAALPLAGGPAAFTLAELIEGGPGDANRRLLSASELAQSDDGDLAALLAQVTGPRGAIAGLPETRLADGRPVLMGIVNVTPDSFSDGGLYDETEGAVAHAASLVQAGAEIIDIGGESTRPGAETVPGEDELSRVVPVVAELRGIKAAISIDTRKADVARAAAEKGATIFNDVSALTFDADSLATAAELGLEVVLMHAQGEPKTMQHNPSYDDVVLEVYDYLAARIGVAMEAGIPREKIIADLGIGFGKTIEHNLELLSHVSLFHGLGVPLLIGASRKKFIHGVSGETTPKRREPGSQAAGIAAVSQGAQILRVHDVAGAKQSLEVWRGAVYGPDENA
ncbi:dihydropteroate synthase [Methyloligella sp. 2.7D]|uniref:dihydropteroate synthase n=1 Tax=unclassified Methyloligella TaxID=2625955 RepID=UPI00157E0D96|nr:dihydropteroate synthase [Methyloligella sp. GL2]QKP76840.1 dihydropteroate synthase [Methyloligella sp. GL2]